MPIPAGFVALSSYIPEEDAERLKRVSFELGMPQQGVIQQAIAEKLPRLEKEVEKKKARKTA